MTRPLSLVAAFLLVTQIAYAQIGIGTTTPHLSSIVDVSSTTQGFLPPRLTFEQINNINTPAEGLMVFCTDCCSSTGTVSTKTNTEWNYFIYNGCQFIDMDFDGIPNDVDPDIDGDGILNQYDNISIDLPSNPGFENHTQANGVRIIDAGLVPNWETTASDNKIELWVNTSSPSANTGSTFAELNANQQASLYQDIDVLPGFTLQWSIYHRGRYGVDNMKIKAGPIGSLVDQATLATGNTSWVKYSGTFEIPANVTTIRFQFESLQSGSTGNFIDDFELKLTADDIDNDGIENQYDQDSDNDGIPDNVEYQTTAGYIAPGTATTNGILDSYGNSLTVPVDTDGDKIPDFLDTDSDNDGTTDADESGFTLTSSDKDVDGLHDNADSTPTKSGKDTNGKVINASGINILPDTDGNGEKDYRQAL